MLKYLIFIFTLNITALYSQNILELRVPIVENYYANNYNSMSKNWSITQTKSGLIYVANASALLEYDGEKWNKYQIDEISSYLSVEAVGDRVYVGSKGDFGYWEYDENRSFNYKSILNSNGKRENSKNEDFWNTHEILGLIYFQSNDNIYVYDGVVLTVIPAPYKFNNSYVVNNTVYVEDNKYGLFKLNANKIEKEIGGDAFCHASISGITTLGGLDTLLIVTKNKGLYSLVGGDAVEYKFASSEFLKKNIVFSFKNIKDKYFVFGTVLSGLLITDIKGNVIYHIDKRNGLQNNTVLGLYVDRNVNLWVALNNGLSKVELNSFVTKYSDCLGNIGAVYTSTVYNNKLYLGTNQGLFFLNLGNKSNTFKLIKGSEGQVWTIKHIGGVVICGHNKGTYIIRDSVVENISYIRGAWGYKKIKNNDKIFIGGNYNGLELFEIIDNGIKSLGAIKNYKEPSRFFEFDELGYLWVLSNMGVYRLKFNDTYTTVDEKIFFEITTSKKSKSVSMVSNEGRVYFSDGIRFYKYNKKNNEIEILEKEGKYDGVKYIYDTNDFKIMSKGDEKVIYKKRHLKRDTILANIYFNSESDMMMGRSFENVSQISPNQLLFGAVDGYYIFDSSSTFLKDTSSRSRPIVRDIFSIDENNNYTNLSKVNLNSISYNNRFINFRVVLPEYNKDIWYNFYLLKGVDTIRYEENTSGKFSFRNNEYGDFNLKVRARYSNNDYSEYGIVKFTIEKPMLISNLFIFSYSIILTLLFFVIRQLYNNKQDRQKKTLLKKIETQQLALELTRKSYQLTNIAKRKLHKNKVLKNVKDKIIDINERSSIKMPKKYIKEIYRYLDSCMDEAEAETMFEENFKSANKYFYKKLIYIFPDLSSGELKLAAYLRMNLSTKEIAELLNITPKSLEVSRYRLRKKLKLKRKENLVSFLLSI